MDFDKSPLKLEVDSIISNPNAVHFHWRVQIHANDEIIEAYKVLTIDNLKDFELNYTDEIMLCISIPFGTYVKRVYPYRSKLEITLTRCPLKEQGSESNYELKIVTEKFIAVLADQGNPVIESNTNAVRDESSLNLTEGFAKINIQLINKAINLIRMKSVGGVYRKVTPADVIKTILTKESQNIDLEKELLPMGVDMVEPNNKALKDHVLIPHGTRLVDMSDYINSTSDGVYNTGLGLYYQNRNWFLYPLYNTDRFDDSETKLTIINVPGSRLMGIERTFRRDGNNVVALATGETRFADKSDYEQLNLGNGVRFTDANKIMNDFATVKNNKVTASRGNNNNEVITNNRELGNNVQLSRRSINSNVYKEYAEMARREGSIITMVWENADIDFIKPGLPIIILYLDPEGIKKLRGVLLKAHVYTYVKGQAMMAGSHYTTVVMSIFVNRKNIET